MRYALDPIGARMEAAPGRPPGTCPTCGGPARAKTGKIVTWHWAHINDASCDPWAEPDSEWHRTWQEFAPPERREVVMPPHRADLVTADGWVVELQHSSISPDEIREREEFYGPRMIWVFDARDAYEGARLRLRLDPQWIADYQAEVAAICAQSGLDPQEPLELTLVGLAAAPSEPEPFTSLVRVPGGPEAPGAPEYIPRHANGGHAAYGELGPGVVIPLPKDPQ